jgi:hypothetical protein
MKPFLVGYLKYLFFAIGILLTLHSLVFAARGLDRFEVSNFIASIIFGIIGIPLLTMALMADSNDNNHDDNQRT